jgi:hypothetical protein
VDLYARHRREKALARSDDFFATTTSMVAGFDSDPALRKTVPLANHFGQTKKVYKLE